MTDRNEPSEMDHDAPYNEVIDGCGCDYCERERRREREADRVDDLRDEQIEELLMPLIISLQEYSPTAHNGDAVGKTAVLEELENLRAWINETPEACDPVY